MTSRFDLIPDFYDPPFFINDKGGSFYTHVFFPVHRFLNPKATGFQQGVLFIRKKWEVQAPLGLKLLVTLDRIWADSNDFNSLKIGHRISEVAGFLGASGRIILGIKVDDGFRALEGFESVSAASLIWQ